MESTLPPNFAIKLLDKEIELESECSLSNLTELVELYRQAIVYYEDIKNSKYWDFQERLKKILLRPDVLNLMQEENKKYRQAHLVNTRERSKTEAVRLPPKIKSCSPKKQENPNISYSNIVKSADKAIKKQKSLEDTTTVKALSNIKLQENSLEERIRLRQQKNLNTSVDSGFCPIESFQFLTCPVQLSNYESSTSSSFFFDFEDRSLNYSSYDISEELENIIEKIMEENFAEKTEKITEIKVMYETQINELCNQGENSEATIKSLQEKMKTEINNVTILLDLKRKKDVENAKTEFKKKMNF